MNGRAAWRMLRVAFPIALLYLVLRTIDWQSMADRLRSADGLLLGVAFALFVASVVIQGHRWHILLESAGEAWPRARVQLVHFAAMLFDLFLPGKLGSDAYRVAMLRRPGRLRHMIVTLVALRLHGMAACLVVAIVACSLILGAKHGSGRAAIGGIAVSSLAAGGVVLADRLMLRSAGLLRGGTGIWHFIGRHYDEARAAFVSMLRDRWTMARSSLWVVFYLAAIICCYWAAGRAFGMKLPLSSFIAVTPILLLMAAMPITIQGRGLTELIAIFAWEGARASREQIVLTCFAVYAMVVLQGLLGGLVAVFIRARAEEAAAVSGELLPPAAAPPGREAPAQMDAQRF